MATTLPENSDPRPVIVIVGPTASGKTDVAVALAKRLGTHSRPSSKPGLQAGAGHKPLSDTSEPTIPQLDTPSVGDQHNKTPLGVPVASGQPNKTPLGKPTGVSGDDAGSDAVGAEVVSADSRQVYRYMDVATAKPTRDEMAGVPHHGFDVVDPDVVFSAGRFMLAAREWIDGIRRRGRWAIVAGGSGLYVQALVDGLFSGADAKDPAIRRALEQRADREGLEGLYEELQRLDPVYAEKTLPGDRQRILRALEVAHTTGERFSDLHRRQRNPLPWPVVMVGLHHDRDVLYDRINRRARGMLDRGLLAEVRDLVDRGYGDAYAMKSVGYEEGLAYLRGEIASEDELVETIARNTRRYAKRQLTWFRRDDRIVWLGATGRSADDLAAQIHQGLVR